MQHKERPSERPTPDSSSATSQETLAAATDQLHRPARALIGWMPHETASRVLLSNRADLQPTDEQVARVRAAQAAVASRPEGVDQTEVITEAPTRLAEYIGQLQASTVAEGMYREGWTVVL